MRSSDPDDYQQLAQPIAVMVKSFSDGHEIAAHLHARDQFLYATLGIMRLHTDQEAWVVPQGSAVYIPAGTRHAVRMHGDVEMCTLYIAAPGSAHFPKALAVLAVTPLMRELILALSEEPVHYEAGSRGDHVARLIEIEIGRARELSLNVPLPKDSRLQRLCAELLANPSDRRTLDGWSEAVGASPRTLARLFESDLGMGFSRWRQRLRFHNALQQLAEGHPISRIAERHGYRSTSAFTAAFGRVMGITPSQVASAGSGPAVAIRQDIEP